METTISFAPTVNLSVRKEKSLQSQRWRPVCTHSPRKPAVSEELRPKPPPIRQYRVLPDDLPPSKRPPLPPFHRSIPFVGYVLELALGILSTQDERRQRYGPIYDSNFFFGNFTHIANFSAIIDVLRDAQVFRSDGALPVIQRLFGYDAMLTLDGVDHTYSRGTVAPAFVPVLYPLYLKCIRARANRTLESVLAMKNRGEEVKLKPIFREHYLTIAVEMTTGIDMDGENARRIRELFVGVQNAIFTPGFGPDWNAGVRGHKELMKVLREVIRKNLAERADVIEKLRECGDDPVKLGVNNIGRNGVDVLLVAIANSSLSTKKDTPIDEEVADALCRSIILLWFAGYSTTSAVTLGACFEMGFDDELRDRLVAEQDRIVTSSGNGDRTVTYSQVMSEMPLLDSYLLEIMRLHAPVSGMNRKTACDVEILGRFVPKGRIVTCDFDGAMYDPEVYPDPYTLKADRFLNEDGTLKPVSLAILSFGAIGSPHYCLGAAFSKVLMKATMATLLREYTYTLDSNQRRDYAVIPEAAPKSGVIVERFEKRF